MCSTMAVDIWASFCGVLKTHLRLASIGSTMRAEAAKAIIGVSASARHVDHGQRVRRGGRADNQVRRRFR